jgi:hypothetical protein
MKSFVSQLWSLGLEPNLRPALEAEMINKRHVELLLTDDPVLAGMGGACVFVFARPMLEKAKDFLRAVEGGYVDATTTNNPSLLPEIKKVVEYPPDVYLALFSSKLKASMSQGEFDAVVQHEYGHVNHRHLEQQRWGGYHEFITHEKEADNYAVTAGGAKVEDMITGLEKAMHFGAEQAVLWQQGASNSFIRKLLDSDIIDAATVKFAVRQARMMHGARFTTLKKLKAQRDAGKAETPIVSSGKNVPDNTLAKHKLQMSKIHGDSPERQAEIQEEIDALNRGETPTTHIKKPTPAPAPTQKGADMNGRLDRFQERMNKLGRSVGGGEGSSDTETLKDRMRAQSDATQERLNKLNKQDA